MPEDGGAFRDALVFLCLPVPQVESIKCVRLSVCSQPARFSLGEKLRNGITPINRERERERERGEIVLRRQASKQEL